jgi:hypothetical protein
MLFELLEIRFRLVQSDPDVIIKLFVDGVTKRYGNDIGVAFASPRALATLRIAVGVATEHHGSRGIAKSYQRFVLKLAPHAPILAYKLRNHSLLADLENHVDKYFDEYIARLAVPPEQLQGVRAGIETAASAGVSALRAEAIMMLRDDIRLAARRIGPLTMLACWRALRRQDRPSTERVGRYLSHYFDELDKKLGHKAVT